MSKHDGGEGSVGKNLYIYLCRLEELVDFNNEYEIFENFKNYFIFGTDEGDMLLGYNFEKNIYYAIDSCNINENEIFYTASSIKEFFIKMDKEMSYN